MSTDLETRARSSLAPLLTALVGLGLIRAAGRVAGLAALLVVVIATTAALVIGIVVLRLLLLH
jgi:hypothetical protein